MRIGVVTTSYPLCTGDSSGAFVADLNQWVQSRGHQVEVLAAGDGSAPKRLGAQQIPVERIAAGPGLFYQGGAPEALGRGHRRDAAVFSARLLWRIRARARHWDGIIAHWLAPCALAAHLAAPRLPIWAIAHGGDVHLLAKLGLCRFAGALFDRPNSHLNFVSKSLQNVFATSLGASGKRVVAASTTYPMGIDLDRLQRVRPARKHGQRPRVVFLGRLVAIKGVDILLRALRGLDRDCDVVVAGDGPEALALRRTAERLGVSVEFCGHLAGPNRDALLASADIVVVPSRQIDRRTEGLPQVALEALAVGAQLLVAKSGGLEEIPESICHHFSPDNPVALRQLLRAVLDGQQAAFAPGHWLTERSWPKIAPWLLPGL